MTNMTAQEVQPHHAPFYPFASNPKPLQTPPAQNTRSSLQEGQILISSHHPSLPQPTGHLESSMPSKSNSTRRPIKSGLITEDASPVLNCTTVRTWNAARVVLPTLPFQMKAGSSAAIYPRQLCLCWNLPDTLRTAAGDTALNFEGV